MYHFKHGERCPDTKLYWNDKTKKWLVKPVRESVKGSTTKKKLEGLKESSKKWKSYSWLPINLTVQDIQEKANELWNDKSVFDLDRALSLSSLLIVKRTTSLKKNTFAYKRGYINVHSDDLQKWVGYRYDVYLKFFEKAGIIDNYKKGRTGYKAKGNTTDGYTKQYRFNQKLLIKDGDMRKYHKVEYTSSRLLVKLYNNKEAKKAETLKTNTRLEMMNHVYSLVETIDLDAFNDYCLLNPKEFKNKDVLNDTLVMVTEIKNGNIYINPKCDYGHRFHSVFTNTKKLLRKFIMIDGTEAGEVDLKNSQFFFLACMTLYPDVCAGIFKQKQMQMIEVTGVLHTLQHFYTTYPDFKEFIDASLAGTIYQDMINQFKAKGKTYTKKKVKEMCFNAFFSAEGECPASKKKLSTLYPSLIRVCEYINGKEYPLPQLLQRLESAILIDMVAVMALQNTDSIFTTVHDSFLCSANDMPLFKAIIEDVFTNIGLPVPNVDIKKIDNNLEVKDEVMIEDKSELELFFSDDYVKPVKQEKKVVVPADTRLPDMTSLQDLRKQFEEMFSSDTYKEQIGVKKPVIIISEEEEIFNDFMGK